MITVSVSEEAYKKISDEKGRLQQKPARKRNVSMARALDSLLGLLEDEEDVWGEREKGYATVLAANFFSPPNHAFS